MSAKTDDQKQSGWTTVEAKKQNSTQRHKNNEIKTDTTSKRKRMSHRQRTKLKKREKSNPVPTDHKDTVNANVNVNDGKQAPTLATPVLPNESNNYDWYDEQMGADFDQMMHGMGGGTALF